MIRQSSRAGLAAHLLFILSLLLLTACAQQQGAADAKYGRLIIYHTNDIHGHANEVHDNGNLRQIGYGRLKTVVDLEPEKNKMLLDAGDILHGQPFATARKGDLVARLLPVLGYDALAVGNHDFDYGLERLLELRDTYNLPFLAANVVERASGKPPFPSYIVKDFNGFKVGIFGLSTPETPRTTTPANVETLSFGTPEELAATAKAVVRQLREREKADLVVALAHIGTNPFDQPNSQWIAKNVPGIDLIIDGHSHSEVEGLKVGRTMIVSTGAFFNNLGKVEAVLSGSRPQLKSRLIKAEELEGVAPDPAVDSMMKKMELELDKELGKVVGSTPVFLNGNRHEIRNSSTNLGRLVTATMIKYTGADAAIFNSGSIRASIPAGKITRGLLLEVLPYGNYAITVRLKGSELRKVMEKGLAEGGQGSFLQFYGLNVQAVKNETKADDGTVMESYRIQSININGQPLLDEAEYIIAINDFMNEGGDGYDLLKRPSVHQYETIEEMLLKFLSESSFSELAAIDRADNLIVSERK